MDAHGKPRISIVVRAFNEEKDLPALLDGIAAQSLGDHEVVLVDSGSYDRTREIAQERGARVVRIDSRDFTFGYSLNVGIRECRADLVAIASAHTFPASPDWLQSLVAAFDDPKVAMAFGRQLGNEESNFAERQDLLATFRPDSEVMVAPRVFANNANSAIRKALWEEHPFDEALTGLEDIEWARYWMERGRAVLYRGDAPVFHIHRETWRQVRHRHYREAVAARGMGLRGWSAPRLLVRELRAVVRDLVHFPFRRLEGDSLRGALRFRYEKTLGLLQGLREGRLPQLPESHDDLYFDRVFRFVQIVEPGRAHVVERRVPAPKPSEVLIEVAYVGVCGTDLEVLNGTLGYFADGRAGFPIVPGHEVSGRVAAVGANVSEFGAGDHVVVEPIQGCGACPWCAADNAICCDHRREMGVFGKDGGYGAYIQVQSRFVHALPPELDLLRAALCEPTAVVLKGLRRVAPFVVDGSEALVVGGGAIGVLVAAVLRHRGHRVTLVEQEEERRSAIAATGIRVVPAIPGDGAFRLIVEATGNADALRRVLGRGGPGAAILILGFPYGPEAFNFESVVASDQSVIGSVGSGHQDFEAAIALLPSLDVGFLLENTVPLDQFQKAWRLAGSRAVPKVILEVMPGPSRRPDEPSREAAAAASPP